MWINLLSLSHSFQDIEEFHITHDILKLSNVIYNQFVKFSPINAASIDLNQRIEIKKKE